MTDKTNIIAALVKCQTAEGWGNPARTKTVNVKTGAGSYKFSYAPLDGILDQVRPILAANKLVLSWSVEQCETGPDRVKTTLWHESGESIKTDVPIITAGNGPQAYGSGMSYACRYGAVSLLGLAGADDDDANMAEGNHYEQVSKPRPIKTAEIYGNKDAEKGGMAAYKKTMAATVTPEQAAVLQRELEAIQGDVKRFCKLFGVAELDLIPAEKYADALKLIEAKKVKGGDNGGK